MYIYTIIIYIIYIKCIYEATTQHYYILTERVRCVKTASLLLKAVYLFLLVIYLYFFCVFWYSFFSLSQSAFCCFSSIHLFFFVCLCYIYYMVLGDIILLLLLFLCFDFVFFFCFFLVVGKIRKEIVVFVIPVVRCLKEQIVCASICLLLFLCFGNKNTNNSFPYNVDKDFCSEANIVINRL